MKDENIAKILRNEGNDAYKQKKFEEALVFYNKSLCSSPTGSENIPLVFANRSAVYFEMNQYEKCLDNIKLALLHNYPQEGRLQKRKEKCMKQLENREKPEEKFFQLSYPANEMIPFIANCLELREDDQFGRYIFTSEDLNPGDVIAIEEVYFRSIKGSARFSRCAFCLSSNKLSLIPCNNGCSNTMFCNEECQKEGMKKFHGLECEFSDAVHLSDPNNESEEKFDPFDMLRILTESLVIAQNATQESIVNQSLLMQDVYPETLFDFDLGLKFDKSLDTKHLQIVNILEPGFQESLEWIYEDTAHQLLEKFPVFKTVIKCDEDYDLLVCFIVRFMLINKRNSSKVTSSGKVDGAGVQLFGSLLNHSCDPNLTNISMDNKFAIVVTKPIKKGEQLFVSYIPTFAVQKNRDKRRSKLLRDFNFNCTCEACDFDLNLMNLPRTDKNFAYADAKLPETHQEAVSELHKNCEYIKANYSGYPCLEVSVLLMRNNVLLKLIAEKEAWME